MRKVLLVSLILLIGLIVGFAILVWLEWYDVHRKSHDMAWWSRATVEERRDLCHRRLKFPFGNNHIAAIGLTEIGTADSVPLLIDALSRYGSDADDLFKKSCVVDALETLTGCSPGSDYSDWKKWWENTGSKLPRSSFYPRIKPKATSTSASFASTSSPALSPVLP